MTRHTIYNTSKDTE